MIIEVECKCPECEEIFHHEFVLDWQGGNNEVYIHSKTENEKCGDCGESFRFRIAGDLAVDYDC